MISNRDGALLGLLLAVVVVAVAPNGAGALTLELTAVRDNTLFQDADGDTSNGAGAGNFCGRNSQGRIRRAVLRFDVAATLPANAVLDSARLVLHMASSSDPLGRTLRLHRVLADWGEAGSSSGGGNGATAQSGDATWLHTFYPAAFWSSAGGDFVAGASASTGVVGAGDYAWQSAALADDVRAWLAAPATNFGWILIGDESVANTARRFDSRESATADFRPRLILYVTDTTPVLPASWGHLKSRFR